MCVTKQCYPAGSTPISFLEAALEALGTRSTRDNQSMCERCFRQSERAPALLARGQLFSHVNAR